MKKRWEKRLTNVNGQMLLTAFYVSCQVFVVEISAFRTHSTNKYRTGNGHSEDQSRTRSRTNTHLNSATSQLCYRSFVRQLLPRLPEKARSFINKDI